ncbi:MAG: heavy metal translocating P-type ATPase, partial [Flavobacteriaceae bacterium]|nr:heavy metal translocating P-type ATPase [Flavobacteriaceae bacterium]
MAACCEPHNEPEGGHFRWLGSYTELYFSLASGFCLLVGFLLEIGSNIISLPSVTAYLTAYFFGGFFTFLEAIKKLRKGIFEIDFLMLVAAIGAAYLGKWAEGALLLFLFSLGHALEHYAMGKARRSIAALTDLAPKTALVKINGDLRETDITNLSINDTIVVRPNSKIPADGFIVSGESSVNQAPITGESVPVDKIAVLQLPTTSKEQQHLSDIHRVFAGTINGNATLEITVTKKAEDSTLSRLITMVEEAKTQKSPTQLFTDRFEKYYVPLVLLLVVLLNFAYLVVNESWSDSFYRAMAVLVAASPCALAISTPSAVLSGIARAARGGVLIKGGKPLEDLGSLTAIAFDKTGTLTEGSPKITDVI